MTDINHCSHHKSYQEDCHECDRVWGHSFMSEEQKTLARFYNVNTKEEIITAQARHIKRLQEKLAAASHYDIVQTLRPQRVREG